MKKILSVVFAMVLALSCFFAFAGCEEPSQGNGGASQGNGGTSQGDGGTSQGNGGTSQGNGGTSQGNGGSSQGDGGSSQGNDGTSQGNQETPPCEHDYVETQVEATCTEEGYNLFTCSKCQDSYKGETVIPVKNHTGIGKCKVCDADFDPMWKEFINKNSSDDNDNKIVFEGNPAVVLSYNNGYNYDCLISALIYVSDGTIYQEDILTFAYNSYDKEWTWLYSTELGFVDKDNPIEGSAGGKFSQWSSRSNSLNCDMRTGSCKTDSDLLDTIKALYNYILDTANAKLKECGYNITMENFGLSK